MLICGEWNHQRVNIQIGKSHTEQIKVVQHSLDKTIVPFHFALVRL